MARNGPAHDRGRTARHRTPPRSRSGIGGAGDARPGTARRTGKAKGGNAGARPQARRGRGDTSSGVREQILDAAQDLFATHAPASVTVRDIARRAGVEHSLIHRHFGSKDNLVREAFLRNALRYIAEVEGADDAIDGFALFFAQAINRHEGVLMMLQDLVTSEGTDLPPSSPGVAVHILQLEAEVKRIGPERAALQLRKGESLAERVRLTTICAILLMSAWAIGEDWVVNAGRFGNVERDELRQRLFATVQRLVMRELGLDAPVQLKTRAPSARGRRRSPAADEPQPPARRGKSSPRGA